MPLEADHVSGAERGPGWAAAHYRHTPEADAPGYSNRKRYRGITVSDHLVGLLQAGPGVASEAGRPPPHRPEQAGKSYKLISRAVPLLAKGEVGRRTRRNSGAKNSLPFRGRRD
jgi:hypothetical protein